jgi:hypothetical protein
MTGSRVRRVAVSALAVTTLAVLTLVLDSGGQQLGGRPVVGVRSGVGSPRAGWEALSVAARGAVSRGLGADSRAYWARAVAGDRLLVANPAQQLTAWLSTGRVSVAAGDRGRLALSGLAVGRTGGQVEVRLAASSSAKNRVAFDAAGVREWFLNGPYGIEQKLSLSARPAGRGPLIVSQRLSGTLAARLSSRGAVSLELRGARLAYGDLLVTDADGRTIPAVLRVAEGRLEIVVDDARAVYPLTIDPTITQTAELSATGLARFDSLGYAVAISGSTIVAGCAGHNSSRGAVYVYTMPATGGWQNATQTAELTASNARDGDRLGTSVAISGDTIVAGAIGHNGIGAVYVFTKPISGGWRDGTESAALLASDGFTGEQVGFSVAISGGTIVAGTNPDGQAGEAYVYTMPATGGWKTADQTAELVNSDFAARDEFGGSVAVSGTTIVVGAPGEKSMTGAVYEYTMPAGGWKSATQTAELTASDGAKYDELGFSVGVSGDVIVGGAPEHNAQRGAVYLYTKPATGDWQNTTQTAELTATDSDGSAWLGSSVAISGVSVVAGAPNQRSYVGALYEYTMPATDGWQNATQTEELTATDGTNGDGLGSAVAAEGNTIVAGAPGHNAARGAVYEYSVPPVTAAPGSQDFGTQPLDTSGAPQAFVLTNISTQSTPIAPFTAGPQPDDFLISASTCPASLAAYASCTVYVRFSPTATGARNATLMNLAASGARYELATMSGTGSQPPQTNGPTLIATETRLSSSLNPAEPGQQITLTATISPAPNAGSVEFADGGTTIPGCAEVPVDPTSGTAVCTAGFPAAGTAEILAIYSGDALYDGSESALLTQQVTAGTTGGTGGADGSGSTGPTGTSGPTGGATESIHLISSPKPNGDGVTVKLSCSAPKGQICQLTVVLESNEALENGQPAAVSAADGRHRRDKRIRVVAVGRSNVKLAADSRKSITIKLNPRGRRLLKHFGKLPVILTVELRTQGAATVALKRKLTITHKQRQGGIKRR